VYTSGIDQKVSQFSLIESSGGSSTPSRWVRTTSKRMHSHDVRGLSIWPPYTPLPSSHRRSFPTNVAPLLVSGGLDMSVAVTPAALAQSTTARITNPLATSITATFEDAYHRRIAYSSGAHGLVGVHLAKRARLVLSTGDTSLAVWRLTKKSSLDRDPKPAPPAEGVGWNKVLEMDLRVHTNLVASAISDDGRWLVVSDAYETKLFLLQAGVRGLSVTATRPCLFTPHMQSSGDDLKPVRVRDFQKILQEHLPDTVSGRGASALIFSPDSSKLIVATSTAFVLVLDLVSDSPSAKVLRRFDQHRYSNQTVEGRCLTGRKSSTHHKGDGSESESDADGLDDPDDMNNAVQPQSAPPTTTTTPATITRMAISPDGQWLATTDDHRRTHIFNLDAVQHHTSLPSFPQPAHALAFAPNVPSLLILGFANNTLELYDVEARQFPPWSRALCSALPKRFTNLHDSILGVTLAPDAAPDRSTNSSVLALFWGATWLCKVQFDAPVGWGGFEKKRRRRRSEGGAGHGTERDRSAAHNFKLVTHYRQILLADFLAPGELVIVERPLTDVLASLPPAYYRPKYGAS
jgi:U3 small nucleolar RNA-associated protein 4